MLACQERQDWLGLADCMEYELIECCKKPIGKVSDRTGPRLYARVGFMASFFRGGRALSPCFLGGGRVMANFFQKALKQPANPTITITKVL